MSIKPVEWVLLVRFGSTAHRATYGRFPGSTYYSKDFIQLSRKSEFIEDLEAAFPDLTADGEKATLTYRWPGGSAPGTLFKRSADRPHLSWPINNAPLPWKMSENPTAVSAETIRGDPSLGDEEGAESQFDQLISSGFGQPFLIAVKLKGEPATLHLRVHVDNPDTKFKWADMRRAPPEIRALAATTSNSSALAWRFFPKEDDALTLYFDPESKVFPWRSSASSSNEQGDEAQPPASVSTASQASDLDSDSTAESLDYSEAEVSAFEERVDDGDYTVPDATATVKTRGSAQRVFSGSVKDNYGWRCALTGIKKREFLIASHIVPWSIDETIRLDPANGICLSVLVDRAFEHGFIVIQDDLTISVDWDLVADDQNLAEQLVIFDGAKINPPKSHPPKIEYLKRRRSSGGTQP